MCGINGFSFKDKNLISKMHDYIKNRGPDSSGNYLDDDISLGHTRLSVIDTDPRADQPLEYKNLVIVYNGEIYNYLNLRKKLIDLKVKLKTFSDTEVIVALFDLFGVNSFKMLSGIFALSIWDKKKKKLYLLRDIIGVKPLYYKIDGESENIFFSSSINALKISNQKNELSDNAFYFYQNLGRNDSYESFIKGIFKLNPGELIVFKNKKIILKKKILKFNFKKNKLSNNDIKIKIENIIKKQFISDVPVALSLSGGIDSNIVYHCLRKYHNESINIYSFYFRDYEKFNEDFYTAKKNVEHFGGKLIPIEISYNDFINFTEKSTLALEEPLRSEASVLNYVMAKNVKEKVLLTGDGGDEIFTGYDQYRSMYYLSLIDKFNFLKKIFKDSKFANKQLNRLFLKDSRDLYLSFSERNLYINPNIYFKNFREINVDNLNLNHSKKRKFGFSLDEVIEIDLDTKVQNDYFKRNDAIFMNNGIELRVPFYDEEMINYFLKLNIHKKFGFRGKSKYFLHSIFRGEIYRTTKKKWGLQSPLAKWMKKELQPYLKEILSPHYYSGSKNYLNFDEIQKLIMMHKERYFNHHLLWSLVSLQIYLRKNKL